MIYITPNEFRTIPCPTYPEIPLSILPGRKVGERIESFRPCVIHIATEGPLGLAARRYCVKQGIPFTTAFHTKFPDYVYARFRIPVRLTYRWMRWFHNAAEAVMVATHSIEEELRANGITKLVRWTRGVDTGLFRPRPKTLFHDLPRPIYLYVGRVAVEKNIESFLSLDLPGSKVVVGDGPLRDHLSRQHPEVFFAGPQQGESLAEHYASADAFVFPSLTDTFGLVVLEALASGLPVAAYPVPGPKDVVGTAPVAVLNHDLHHACLKALEIDPTACRAFALQNSWDVAVDQFLSNVARFDPALIPGGQTAPAPEPTPEGAQQQAVRNS